MSTGRSIWSPVRRAHAGATASTFGREPRWRRSTFKAGRVLAHDLAAGRSFGEGFDSSSSRPVRSRCDRRCPAWTPPACSACNSRRRYRAPGGSAPRAAAAGRRGRRGLHRRGDGRGTGATRGRRYRRRSGRAADDHARPGHGGGGKAGHGGYRHRRAHRHRRHRIRDRQQPRDPLGADRRRLNPGQRRRPRPRGTAEHRARTSPGLALGDHGGLRTNVQMQVLGHENIWAGGDCVEVLNLVSGQYQHVALGTHANEQGRVIGHNLAGSYATFPGWSARRWIRYLAPSTSRGSR